MVNFSCSAYAQERLSNEVLENKAREAVKLAYQKAVVEGNSWIQQVFSDLDSLPAKIEPDPLFPDSAVRVVLSGSAQQCAVYVTMDPEFGFTMAPVSFECVGD